MKMSINGIENQIDFVSSSINVIEISNKLMFNKVINYINKKCNKEITEDNEIVLLENGENINFYDNVILVVDLFNMPFNDKKYMNKIYDKIVKNIENDADFKADKILLELRNYFIEEINELPFEFTVTENVNIIDLLKAYKLKIDEDIYENMVEKVEFIIDLVSNLELAKIIIIPNLKTFLNNDELVEIYKYFLYNNLKLLIIESQSNHDKIDYENKIIIDEEFDDYKL